MSCAEIIVPVYQAFCNHLPHRLSRFTVEIALLYNWSAFTLSLRYNMILHFDSLTFKTKSLIIWKWLENLSEWWSWRVSGQYHILLYIAFSHFLVLFQFIRMHALTVRKAIAWTSKCLWTERTFVRPRSCVLINVKL